MSLSATTSYSAGVKYRTRGSGPGSGSCRSHRATSSAVRAIEPFMRGILRSVEIPSGVAVRHHPERPVIRTEYWGQPVDGGTSGSAAYRSPARQHARNHEAYLML